MANTSNAKKAIRSSKRKATHNKMWKKKIKLAIKDATLNVNKKTFGESLSKLQKTVDKATKKNVIHKNKANRIKSAFAKKDKIKKE